MTELLIFVFLAGVVTVVSPCVLPVLPIVLSTSVSAGKLRPLGVVLGLVGAFTVVTLATAAAAQALALPAAWLRVAAILALGLFGVTMLVPAVGRAWERVLAPLAQVANSSKPRSGLGGGLLMGAGLGLLWSPCVGPIMATVIALAVSRGVTTDLLAITLAYGAGAGVPLLLIGYGARRLTTGLKGFGRRTEGMRRGFGALTVLAAMALLLGLDTRINNIVPASWSGALTGIEQTTNVQKELTRLEANTNQPGANMSAAQDNMPSLPVQAAEQPAAVAPTATATTKPGLALPDLGPAPELTGITGWINSKPLTLQALRGKVVIVSFWTFGCYNCRNTEPYVRALYDKYHIRGLEILGVHSPEFAYERVPDNVRAASKEQGVRWPVALDPDFKTWSAYNNEYWPAFYFVDAKGRIRYTHFGEGNYEYHDKVVAQLLSEAAAK